MTEAEAPLRLWTVVTVARRLAVSRSMVLRQIRARRLAAIRIGRYWRIEPAAVVAFVERFRQTAAEPEPPVVDDRQLALFDEPVDRLSLADEEAALADGLQTLGKLEAAAARRAAAADDVAGAEAAVRAGLPPYAEDRGHA